MTDLSRRGFLRALIAAAVATQLPTIPAAEADPLVDAATDQMFGLSINGRPPHSVAVEDVGNGWLRLIGRFLRSEDGAISLDASRLNRGAGMLISSPECLEETRRQFPGQTIFSGVALNQGEMTLSCYIKREAGKPAQVLCPQLEHTEHLTQPHNLVLWSEGPDGRVRRHFGIRVAHNPRVSVVK